MKILDRFFPKQPVQELDQPLFWWGPKDAFTVRNALENTAIFGRTGSGKSSGSGNMMLRSLVRHPNTGGLIIASKPEDKEYMTRIFREERSESDLLIMEPGGQYRHNVLDYMRKNGADTRAITQALMTFGETLERTEGEGGGREPFWRQQNRRQLHNAVEIVTGATGAIDPWTLQGFIAGAALNLAEVADPPWQQSLHFQMLLKAKANAMQSGTIRMSDFNLAEAYWLRELPALSDKTRSSIEAGVMGLLHTFNTGIVKDILSTVTTVGPEDMEDRKWILVDFPITPGDASATFIDSAMKYAVQRYILGRKVKDGDPILCIYTDEYSKVSNSYDAAYLAECRSHRGCMIVLTQSMHAVFSAMHSHAGEHTAQALLTNFGSIILHTLGDHESAEYGSSLLGNRRELFINTSTSGNEEAWDILTNNSGIGVTASESYEPILQPAELLGGLRTGGAPDFQVDGYVIRSGRRFSNNENFLRVSFDQR